MPFLVGCVIFVEPGDDAVAVGSYVAVQAGFGGVLPVGLLLVDIRVADWRVSDVEVGVAKTERLPGACLYPLGVHAERAKEYFPVVLFEIAVYGCNALGLELKEHGVDELHYIIPTQLGQ